MRDGKLEYVDVLKRGLPVVECCADRCVTMPKSSGHEGTTVDLDGANCRAIEIVGRRPVQSLANNAKEVAPEIRTGG